MRSRLSNSTAISTGLPHPWPARNRTRKGRSESSVAGGGTGPSCSTSRQGRTLSPSPAARICSAAQSPLVMCNTDIRGVLSALYRMTARVLLFGAAWIAVLVIMITVVRPHRPAIAVTITSSHPEASPAPPRPGTRYPGWTVKRAYSAHHTMVVDVEAEHPSEALAIAREVVEPLRNRYDEV